ncbi:MAG: hypothetical protein HY903_01975 [Deltaproteobacteria bacterium]|nr:hypothetical protein [Deltaproteobacteria bacterium]
MKFELDTKIIIGDAPLAVTAVHSQFDEHRAALADISTVLGSIVVRIDGTEYAADLRDPIVRLVDQWVRKIPWVVGGDTEAVAYRNSEHCYAFVPAGDAVELSHFAGSESEVEEYILDPITVRLDAFATQSLGMGERVLELIKKLDATLVATNEDCRDLAASLEEGRKAWREYQLHNRR